MGGGGGGGGAGRGGGGGGDGGGDGSERAGVREREPIIGGYGPLAVPGKAPDSQERSEVAAAPSGTDASNLEARASLRRRPGNGSNADNGYPRVRILRPKDTHFLEGQTIELAGDARDQEEGDLSERLSWTIDGRQDGRGRRRRVNLLPGSHVIRASVINRAGRRGFDEVGLQVNPTPKF